MAWPFSTMRWRTASVAGGGVRVRDEEMIESPGITDAVIDRVAEHEHGEVERRERACRAGRPAPEARGKTVILVDDGIATGSTVRAAGAALRQPHPARVVVATPVAPSSPCRTPRAEADEVVCVETPEPFRAVGAWHRYFPRTSDEEVRKLLARNAPEPARI